MNDIYKFKDLDVGDFFYFGKILMIKLCDGNSKARLNNQFPNSVNTTNLHYSVVSPNEMVRLVKRRKEYGPNGATEISPVPRVSFLPGGR